MRLLNAETLEVEDGFFQKNTPPYAILSHTWGDQEVVLRDLDDRTAAIRKAGYRKIERTCRLALKEGFQYVWIDTCCIDKLSSAELSEAINSMFRWYRDAAVCYVYLSDVDSGLSDDDFPLQFRRSKWFTRGWTLQELIAPRQLTFLTSNWDHLSDRAGLSHSISDITGINQKFLRGRGPGEVGIKSLLAQASVAERMSWASARQTTRVEDIAYSLLGIFGVNMPLLYGEGENAFLRLQHTIASHSSDQTLFAWSHKTSMPANTTSGIFATSPSAFANSANLVPFDDKNDIAPFSVTNRGLHITIPIKHGSALLQCRHRDDIRTISTIVLRKIRDEVYARDETDLLGTVSYKAWGKWDKKTVYVLTGASGIQEGSEDGFIIRNLPQGFDTFGFPVGRVIPFRNQLSWKLGGGERFDDAIILRQGGFEARLTLHAWRASRSLSSAKIRKTHTGYHLTTRPGLAPTCIKKTGLEERCSAVAHPEGMLHAAITQENVLGQNIFFVDVTLTTDPFPAAWVRLFTSIDRVYHRAVVWAANAMPATFSISLFEVAERVTSFVHSLSTTLLILWIPWLIYSLIFWMWPHFRSLINPENKEFYISLPLSLEQKRIYTSLLYECAISAILVAYEHSGDAYKPSYSRSADVEQFNAPFLTEFIFRHKDWVHLSILWFISLVLQAVIPSWVLRSPLMTILGALCSFVCVLFAFLLSRSVMESFMWRAILARDQSDGTETSKPEASAKDTGAENRGEGIGSG